LGYGISREKNTLKKKIVKKGPKKPHQNPINFSCYGISRKKDALKKNSFKKEKETTPKSHKALLLWNIKGKKKIPF